MKEEPAHCGRHYLLGGVAWALREKSKPAESKQARIHTFIPSALGVLSLFSISHSNGQHLELLAKQTLSFSPRLFARVCYPSLRDETDTGE